MEISLVAVTSLDGKMTEGDSPRVPEWASKEDTEHFRGLVKESLLIVGGRKTYQAMHIKPTLGKLFVVLTRKPEMFAKESVKDQVEFTNQSPAELVASLSERGYSKILLVGGGEINRAFLDAGLVSELVVTIEPFVFGSGVKMLPDLKSPVKLKLVDIMQLNKKGTLLLGYTISKKRV